MTDALNIVAGDRYELRSIVARGGFGVVYRGWDRVNEAQVAVKVLAPGFARASHLGSRRLEPFVVLRVVRVGAVQPCRD